MLFARKYFVQFGAMRVIKVKKKKVNLKKDTHPSLYAGKIKFRLQIDFDQ